MPDDSRQLAQRPLTTPEITLSAILGVVLPLAGLIVVGLAISSTVRHGQRTATYVLVASFVAGVVVLALLLSQA